jgi:hypothetical protein
MNGRWAPVTVGVFTALVALGGIDARATYGARVSGDEPQYLLTATSIGEDGNLDIADEIAEGRYRAYHEIDLDPQTLVLDDTDRQISPHDALLPALLAVPMRVGGWAAAKGLLVVIAGVCAAVTTWVAIRRVGLPARPAAIGVTAAFVGLPLAAYGSQVYPEMPAALAVVAAVALLTSPAPTWWHDLGVLVALIVLPWLAVKYAPVVAVLGIALLLRHRHDTPRIAILAGGAAVATLAYVVAHRAWYGGWTVYASGDHFAETGELSVVGTKVNLLGRSRRLAGLLVDRDFGIAAWSPVWLLAPFGLGLLTARRWPGRWLVPAVITAGWLTATFVALTMHGFWVPGRQIVVVLPLAALGLAAVAARSVRWATVTAVLGAVGLVTWCWLAVESSTGRRTLILDFASTAAWPYRAIRPLLPSGLDPTGADLALLVAWGALALGTAWLGWSRGRVRSRRA